MIRHLSRGPRRLVAALVGLAVFAAACGGSGEAPLEIGFRRVALDLAFKDADKAAAVDQQQVIRRFIGGEQFEFEDFVEPASPRVVRRVRIIPRRVERECPQAPPGATPDEPAFAVIKDPPKVGRYPRHNDGQLSIEIGTRTIELPVPRLSAWEIPSLRFVRASTSLNDHDEETADPPDAVRSNNTAFVEMPEYEVTRRLIPGYSVTDTYRYTYTGRTGGDFLYLVKRVTLANGRESVFVPTPPIRMVRLNVTEGAADSGVTHGGVDRDTNVAMTVQSQIVERESVDVCGEVVDTYRVQIKEQFVDLSKNPPEVSGNEGDTTNFWNIQFDNGLLIVREQVNSTYRTSQEVGGVGRIPMVVRYDYVSTLDSTEPEPLHASAKAGSSDTVEEEVEEDG